MMQHVLTVAAHFLEDPSRNTLATVLSRLEAGRSPLRSWFRHLPGCSRDFSPEQVEELLFTVANWHLLTIEHMLRGPAPNRAAELVFAPFTDDHTFVEWLIAYGHFTTGIELLGRAAAVVTGVIQGELFNVQGAMLMDLGEASGGVQHLDKAVTIALGNRQRNTPRIRFLLAGTLLNRANAYRQLKRYTEAQHDVDGAIRSFMDLVSQFPHAVESLAAALVTRGNLLRDLGFPSSLMHAGFWDTF